MNHDMKKIVILQPQFLPWMGVFEQISLSDVYVHYDDVQFPTGRSFTSRVQIKTAGGIQWLTVPILHKGINNINETYIDNSKRWREIHLKKINSAYAKAPHYKELSCLLEEIYRVEYEKISDFNMNALETVCHYLDISACFLRSSDMKIAGKSTQRLVSIVKALKGDIYITGLGARNYMDYELFEQENIRVEFMKYRCSEYTQMNGTFTPYVSIIDGIANEGKKIKEKLNSSSVYWKEFENE